jgi:hypothetical protein
LSTDNNGWIGVDLDGTLAHYDHWRGVEHIGEPIKPMLDRVKTWIAEGRRVKIFTARVAGEPLAAAEARKHIQRWLKEQGLPRLHITNIKDFEMIELWDDRAVQVVPNTGITIADEVLAAATRALRG